jgi:hypothetical protein
MRILLISEFSRLGRNVDEVLKNVMLCKERGLNVYFQKENLSIFDEQGKDNYLDIVQNISRSFTNPQLMRDRVVNKTYCEELPQVTRNKRKRSDDSSLLAGA